MFAVLSAGEREHTVCWLRM